MTSIEKKFDYFPSTGFTVRQLSFSYNHGFGVPMNATLPGTTALSDVTTLWSTDCIAYIVNDLNTFYEQVINEMKGFQIGTNLLEI